MTGLQPAMKPPERMSTHERHGQYSSAEGKHMTCLSKIEGSHSANKNVPDSKIEKAPKDIDC